MGKSSFNDYMSAAAFAEAGEFETARQMLAGDGDETSQAEATNRPFVKTAVFGAISLASYLVLFTRQDVVTELFTMGGWYAVFPVGTALFFSFVHGAFASNLLSTLNLEAKK